MFDDDELTRRHRRRRFRARDRAIRRLVRPASAGHAIDLMTEVRRGMRHIITPRVGQFLSAWSGYVIVAILFRTMTSQSTVDSRDLLQAAVVGFVVALILDFYMRRRRPQRVSGKRRRR